MKNNMLKNTTLKYSMLPEQVYNKPTKNQRLKPKIAFIAKIR